MGKLGIEFSPIHHIPKYSVLLYRAIKTPLMIYLALVGNLVTGIAAAAFFHFEYQYNENVETFFDAIWWAMVTVTTVGYGDISPVTFEGKIIGIFLIVIGVGLFLTFLAVMVTVINALVAEETASSEDMQVLLDRLDRLENSISELKK